MSGWKKDLLIILFLILVSAPLRFINLGYSDFQDDEKKALLKVKTFREIPDYVVKQRKGPMQMFVSYIPYMITGDFLNEYAERIPFAVANIASVITLYLLVKKITKNRYAGLFSALLFAFNGFIVGFSRIVQYQNLNLLFSLLALYFYYDVADVKKNALKSSLIGTFFFSLSVLSHWDAVHYLVPIIFFFILFLIRKDLLIKQKLIVLAANLLLGCALLLPFLVPYFEHNQDNENNLTYFGKRVGLSSYPLDMHRFIFELYNPFYTLPALTALLALGLIFIKKTYLFIIWFLVNFLTIRYFMISPGTHIYNYVLPAIVLGGSGLGFLVALFPKYIRYPLAFVAVLASGVFFYQSFILFVDHSEGEYPWDSKVVFGKETVPYRRKEVLTFGFPHFRNWRGISDFVYSQNDDCLYISNEGIEISGIYMKNKYGEYRDCYYIVAVKRPFISTRDNRTFAAAVGKIPIYRYERDGENYVNVYKIVKPSSKDED
jgi:4-amino-4-deoxy-L-arabinose transferase-like glycosyltransferase